MTLPFEAFGHDNREMDPWFAPERRETKGFVLRSYDVGDGDLLAEAANESYEHLRPWLRWAKPHHSVREAENLVRGFRARYLLGEDFVLGIFSPDEKRLLGGTGFHLREGPVSSGSAEIGMFIRAAEARKRLGTRVLREMLTWGFHEWPWSRLAWRCDQRNLGSARVAENTGMRLEGVLRGQKAHAGDERCDTACYGLTKEEWQGSNGAAHG